MSMIDLHIHTTYSDGTLTPEGVIEAAAARGITLIAITDHDEIGGIAPARAAATGMGITVISGVEINTEIGREDVHILGYGFPAGSAVLAEGLAAQRASRLSRAMLMLDRLTELGYPLSAPRVLEIAGHGAIGRPHIGQAMVEAGYVADINEAFERLIGNRKPAYVPRASCSPEAAITMIRQAGGMAGLAHPGKLGDPPRILHRLVGAGLQALEAYHVDHAPAATERMLRYARQFGLTVTGGSDSHGPRGARAIPIGSVAIPDDVAPQFLAALTHHTGDVPGTPR